MLLDLADYCAQQGTLELRAQAAKLLDMLPTNQHTLSQLRAAITSEDPAKALEPVLGLGETSSAERTAAVKPARLLYTLQARVWLFSYFSLCIIPQRSCLAFCKELLPAGRWGGTVLP